MTFFTNVTLRQFSDSDRPADATTHIFLSEYNPAYVDVDRRRARLRSELESRGGGPLGVTRVKEVIIGTMDLSTARRLWRSLLEPTRATAPDLWQIGDGPAIRLVRANNNLLQWIVITVVSLPRAIEFLKQAGLLGSASEMEATFASAEIYGLHLRLVQENDAANNERLLPMRRFEHKYPRRNAVQIRNVVIAPGRARGGNATRQAAT
jgi:hypothetical protein